MNKHWVYAIICLCTFIFVSVFSIMFFSNFNASDWTSLKFGFKVFLILFAIFFFVTVVVACVYATLIAVSKLNRSYMSGYRRKRHKAGLTSPPLAELQDKQLALNQRLIGQLELEDEKGYELLGGDTQSVIDKFISKQKEKARKDGNKP